MKSRLLALCLLTLLLANERAQAQETTDAATRAVPGEPIEIIVRGSKKPDTFESTKAAGEVSEREIRSSAPSSLADALRGNAGVSVQQTTPGQGTIYVRGFAGRELVLYVDGVRFNTAIFRSPNNAQYGLLDPYAVHSAEVIRGPSSVLHGSDALGGAVMLHSPLPPFADAPETNVRLFQSVTSNGLGSVSRVSAQHQQDRWAAQLGVTYARAGDVVPGENARSPDPDSYAGLRRQAGQSYVPVFTREQRGTGFERLSTDAAFRWLASPQTEVVLRGQLSERPELVRYDEITPRFAPVPSKPARASSAYTDMLRAMTSAAVVHRPRESFFQEALVQIAWQRLSDQLSRRNMNESCSDGSSASSCATGVFQLAPASTVSRERTRSDSLSARSELRFLRKDKQRGAILGVEAIHDRIFSQNEVVTPATGEVAAGESRYPNGSTMTQAGVFGQLEAELVPGFRAHVGARGALFSLSIAPRQGAPAAQGAEGIRSTLWDGSGSAGVSWEMTDGFRWVANAGRGVRSPNIEDFAGAGTRAGGRFQIPNRDLEPEHTHSADLGFKVFRELVRGETFLFFSRFTDAVGLATTSVNGQSTAPDGSQYVQSKNVNRLDVYGIESDLRVGREKKGGVFARAVALQYDESDDPTATASERVRTPAYLVLGTWLWPVPRLRLEVFAHGRAPMRRLGRVSDNRIPPTGTDGFVTLHARGAYLLHPDFTLRVGLDNITNRLAVEHGSGFYLPGFSATASLEGRFAL
ncbi:MAG: TonB-dependent receptor [Deltaproteobacteria bacterium]|nr:TonB-dependent receptor [Deltaproteobacteria bacterium]